MQVLLFLSILPTIILVVPSPDLTTLYCPSIFLDFLAQ